MIEVIKYALLQALLSGGALVAWFLIEFYQLRPLLRLKETLALYRLRRRLPRARVVSHQAREQPFTKRRRTEMQSST